MGSVLMALTDVYRYGQLEKITLKYSTCADCHMVSAQDLHRWLLISSSKSCVFQLYFKIVRIVPPPISQQTTLDQDLVDFETRLNASISVSQYNDTIVHKISVSYPTFIKKQQVKLEEENPMHLQEIVSSFFSLSTVE